MSQIEKNKFLMDSKLGIYTGLNHQDYLYFGGAGYYLLQSNQELIEASAKAMLEFGIGCATSRTLTGTTRLLEDLEQAISGFFGTDAAVYLPSGYLTNIAGFQALDKLKLFDIIFIDEFAHYCIYDGAMVAGKKIVPFEHCNTDDLIQKIKTHCQNQQKPLIASDGVFPIKADMPPLDKYLEIAKEFDGIVWIDDSHGVGVLGNNGQGTIEHFDLKSEKLYIGATLSKAFGAYGGFIVGDNTFIETIIDGNVAKGSSSPPNAMVAAALKGIELLGKNPQWRQNLWENARYLKQKINEMGIETSIDHLPIATIRLQSTEKMQNVQKALMESGIYIQYANYVGAGSNGVLRIVVNAFHTKEQIDFMLENLGRHL
jgi:8-amino-7-oxononanoate synthase